MFENDEALPIESTEEPVEENVEETTEEVVEEAENEQESGETADNAEQSDEENSRYAEIRRKAEAKYKAQYEAKQNAMNERFKTAFGKFGVNNVEEYIAKYEEQNRKKVDEDLKKAGIDRDAVMQSLQNTPEMRQLREAATVLAQQQLARQDEEDLKAIQKIDPSVSSWDDIPKMDEDRKYYNLVFEKNMNKVDAYKIAFFDKLMSDRSAATKQAAINAARGKSHMKATTGNASASNDLTDADTDMWKQFGFSKAEAQSYHSKFNKEK